MQMTAEYAAGYLRDVREQCKVTIVLTSHNLEEAEQADRLCILNHGRIVAMGSPGEVKSQPAESYLELDAGSLPPDHPSVE